MLVSERLRNGPVQGRAAEHRRRADERLDDRRRRARLGGVRQHDHAEGEAVERGVDEEEPQRDGGVDPPDGDLQTDCR